MIKSPIPLFVAAAFLLISACSGGGHSDSGFPCHHSHDHHHASHTEMEAGEPADHSIYHASGTWRNRNGEEVSLSNLQVRIQVVSMLYTNCDYACPRILADMKRIESALRSEERRVGK